MAHYVMADLHGEADRFHRMLDVLPFSPEDTLVILGDVIDRGPDGIALLMEIMEMPNAVLLLGNHEHMMLQYFAPDAEEIHIRRWDKNGNAPTLAAFRKLDPDTQEKLLGYLASRPTQLELTVEGEKYFLVHGFPGETTHERVWGRPTLDTPNPIPGCRLIIGHTKVLNLIQPEEKRMQYARELDRRGDHLRILRAPGFIDLDCACGYEVPFKALACLRLEDGAEFYV